MKKNQKKRKDDKYPFIILLFIVFLGIYFISSMQIKTHEGKDHYLYIPEKGTFSEVLDSLNTYKILKNPKVFKLGAQISGYANGVKPGRYKLYNGMNEWRLLYNLLKGKQEMVKLVITKVRKKEDFCKKIAEKIDLNSTTLFTLLNDREFLNQYQLTPDNSLTLMIPNTYSFYWNTSEKNFINRMFDENKKFWNTSRLNLASNMKLSPQEVYILASIIEEETNMESEKHLIASVYLNRLRKKMKLQADPTFRFACNDFAAKRVKGNLTFESPYNTYYVYGLPPGPICIPSISSIDAVLKNYKSDYLYFCAKEDMSGYHTFEKTFEAHKKNANNWRKMLDLKKIK